MELRGKCTHEHKDSVTYVRPRGLFIEEKGKQWNVELGRVPLGGSFSKKHQNKAFKTQEEERKKKS